MCMPHTLGHQDQRGLGGEHDRQDPAPRRARPPLLAPSLLPSYPGLPWFTRAYKFELKSWFWVPGTPQTPNLNLFARIVCEACTERMSTPFQRVSQHCLPQAGPGVQQSAPRVENSYRFQSAPGSPSPTLPPPSIHTPHRQYGWHCGLAVWATV